LCKKGLIRQIEKAERVEYSRFLEKRKRRRIFDKMTKNNHNFEYGSWKKP
jgi:hypothetical protein